ncbi:phosphotransferase enzyme family protein [Telluribacter sp.]|jgi:Ser/Thr protein kinase RdoA (MazF antagonist)|uniref:phosphotransferase enzyme family protein n=1 Tax=Telluribacter sp. TaxID=1978767 RepID=UPI002E1112EF|nr:phosphotransferase [Telluribacter sp.]
MAIFPVTNSTLSARHLGHFLTEKYGFGTDTTCTLFRTGINDSYIITDQKKKFVFRVYSLDWRSEAEIAEEIRLLETLKANDLSVSYAVADRAGTYIQALPAPEGPRYGVLFTYAEGKKIRDLSLPLCHRLGTLMAQMHQLTRPLILNRVTYNLHTLTELPYEYARRHFPEENQEMKFVKRAGEYLRTEIQKMDTRALRSGAVHLDIWYDNMNITDEQEATLFDFDFCGNGYLLYDLAYFIMQLYHTEPDKVQYQARLDHFLAGYETITVLTDEEKKWLPLAGLSIWIFYLGVQSQRFDNWSNIFLTENYLKRYIGMAKNWLAFNQVRI